MTSTPVNCEHPFCACFGFVGFRRGGSQLCPNLRQAGLLGTIGQEAVVTYSHEPGRQDVGQEPADELIDRQRSDLFPVSISAVAVGEADLTVFAREEAMIGNRDPMGVASQVVE